MSGSYGPIVDLISIPVEQLHNFMRDVFLGIGCPRQDAQICADVLITSDLRGIDSHGVGRLKLYYDRVRSGIQDPNTQIDTIKEGPTTLVLDGNLGMGHVIGHRAMSQTIQKAKQYGIAATAVRNSTHYGIAGYYPMMAIAEGMIGLTCTNARPSIAPTFGIEPMLVKNNRRIG